MRYPFGLVRLRRRVQLLFLAATGVVTAPALAIDYHWNVPNGTWNSGPNWNPSGEPGVNDFAHLDYSSNASIQVVGTVPAVGSIDINNGDTLNLEHQGFNDGYVSTIGDCDIGATSAGTLNVLPRGGGINFTGEGHLSVGGTFFVGTLGIVNQSGGTVSIGAASDTVGIDGTYNLSGGTFLSSGLVVDGGTFTMSGGELNVGTLSVPAAFAFNGGTFLCGSLVISHNAQMHLGTGGGKVVHVSDLQIKSGGIDLTDNALIDEDNSSFGAIVNLIRSGTYNGITQTYTGLISSTAIIGGGSAHPRALGYGVASDLGIGTFEGQAVTPGSTLVRYTYSGDTNLDGAVNALDFNRLASNFGGAGKFWSQGDFNNDGIVNTQDFDVLVNNFNQTPISASAVFGAVVPEPCAIALAAFVPWLLRRRERNAGPRGRQFASSHPDSESSAVYDGRAQARRVFVRAGGKSQSG